MAYVRGDRTSTQKLIEELYTAKWNEQVDIREVLRRLYVDQKMTIDQIGRELHVGNGTIHKWLKQHAIATRKMQWL